MNSLTTVRLSALLALALSLTVMAQSEPPQAAEQAPADAPPGETEQSAAPQPEQPSLEQAYQREFAFLNGQKADLERRLAELRQRAEREQNQLRSEIERLETAVVAKRGQGDRLDDLVFESERAVEAARDNTDLLASTFFQADFTLEEAFESELGERAPNADDVERLFAAASQRLAQAGRVERRAGEFFLADGTRVEGQIIHVGRIAAYGLSARGGGLLAPAGGGELKVWPVEAGQQAADSLDRGERPETLPVFLFESLATEVERKGEKSVIDIIQSGGAIGWIITLLGLVGLALVIMRVVFLKRASAATDGIIDSLSTHLRRGDRDAALELLKRHKGSTARVVSAAIRNLDRDREHLEDIVSEAILHESSHLNRFGAVIVVIAAVSPLLGLLGTVTGMISTFDVITEFGTGDPKLLSGGISIALVTTQLGLIVAIPLLLVGNVLSGWAERIKDDMEKAALRVINIFVEARSQAGAGA